MKDVYRAYGAVFEAALQAPGIPDAMQHEAAHRAAPGTRAPRAGYAIVTTRWARLTIPPYLVHHFANRRG